MVDEIPQVNSIFQQPWWLEATSPRQWGVVEIEKSSSIVARLPYVIKRKQGLKLLTMPKLTQTLGPWLAPSTAKYSKQLAQQKDLINSLIEKLPPFDYFSQNFHYSIQNWLPFYWKGFSQTTRYTYTLNNLTDLDSLWADFQENIRREIRKAKKKIVVRSDLSLQKFIYLNELTFKRQGIDLPYTKELVHRIDKACIDHQSRKIFFAEDSQGVIQAAIYIIWDQKSAYYLMGGSDPDLRNSGANSLLMWEAIKFASTVTQSFDFEGSMIEPVERFFRAFGAKQVPYFQVSKMSKRAKVLATGRDFFKASWELFK